MMRKRTRALMAAAASTALLASLAACSPSGSTASDSGGEPGTTTEAITVGVVPIADTAPLWLGEAEGFFDDVGIDLTIQPISGGAVGVTGVVSGQMPFSFSNTVSVMVANSQGIPLRFITAGVATTGEAGADIGAVIVPDDSPIRSAADLEGKTVSVNTLNNIGDTTIRHAVEAGGGDASSVSFVEIGFGEAVAAIENDQVDAAWTVSPFIEQAVAQGARVVSWNYLELSPNLDIAGFFTSEETIKTKPELIERATAALRKSIEFAAANPDRVREIVATYTEIPPDVIESMTMPLFRTDFDVESTELLAESAVKYGTLPEMPDLKSILP